MADLGTVKTVDITSIVRDWINGSRPNHGIRLSTSQGIKAAIDSKESAGIPMQLVINIDEGIPIAEMPIISPDGMSSATPVEVTLTSAMPDAEIYYTLDGSVPTTRANLYLAPFTLPASATVKARAFASGHVASVINTAVFDIAVSEGGGLNNYWSLNEEFPGTYSNDRLGAAGSCIDCPSPVIGRIGIGQAFDGANDLISIGAHSSLDWDNENGFSIEFWVNKSNACSAREVAIGRFDNGTPMQWSIGCNAGIPFFNLVDTNGTSGTVTGTGRIDDGKWHHVVVLYDAYYDEIRLYVDGILEGTTETSYTSGFSSSVNVTAGGMLDGVGGAYLQGAIDEIAFHDRTIPISTIKRHYLDGAIGLREGYLSCSRPVKIMPLGDSNTRRLGYRPTLYFDLINQGYGVDFVGTQSDAITTGSHDRDHEGWSGYTTSDIGFNLNNWLAINPPDTVLLHIGTNDIDVVTVAEAIDSLSSILDMIYSFNPEITVVLGQIINRQTFSQGTADYNDQIDVLIQSKLDAQHKILLVDHEIALEYPGDMSDLKHANTSGYTKMAKVWFDGLTRYLPACNSAAPRFNSEEIAEGQAGVEYRYEPELLANPDGRFTLLTGPPEMRLNRDTGEIRWSPGSAGRYHIDLQIQNAAGSAVQSFVLDVF
jgi:hypothetical protein